MTSRDETPVPVEVELPQWMWDAAEEKGIDLSALLAKELIAILLPSAEPSKPTGDELDAMRDLALDD